MAVKKRGLVGLAMREAHRRRKEANGSSYSQVGRQLETGDTFFQLFRVLQPIGRPQGGTPKSEQDYVKGAIQPLYRDEAGAWVCRRLEHCPGHIGHDRPVARAALVQLDASEGQQMQRQLRPIDKEFQLEPARVLAVGRGIDIIGGNAFSGRDKFVSDVQLWVVDGLGTEESIDEDRLTEVGSEGR